MTLFFRAKPDDFREGIDVVTCFIEWEASILFLQYPSHHFFAGRFAVPGGKIEKGESKDQALERELKEELSVPAIDWSSVVWVDEVYVRRPHADYRLHLFVWKPRVLSHISINPSEHTSYKWQPINALQEIDLIDGQYDAFKVAYGRE